MASNTISTSSNLATSMGFATWNNVVENNPKVTSIFAAAAIVFLTHP